MRLTRYQSSACLPFTTIDKLWSHVLSLESVYPEIKAAGGCSRQRLFAVPRGPATSNVG